MEPPRETIGGLPNFPRSRTSQEAPLFLELQFQVLLDRRDRDGYASGLCSLPPENRDTAKTETESLSRTGNTEVDHLPTIQPDSATVLFCR